MKKTPTKESTHDLSVPLVADPKGCWGNEWSPGDNACNRCADNASCSILFNQQHEQKFKELENTQKYFDRIDFNRVDWDKLLTMVKENPGTLTLEKILDMIQRKSLCKDREMCKQVLKNWIIENKIKSNDGYVSCA